MRLVKLLKEQSGEYFRAQELDQQLHANFKNDSKNLLFRASNNIINDWTIRKIRKDRRPADTAEFVDAIVMALENEYFTDAPKRSRSKFAATFDSYNYLKRFGSEIYICFPHRSANIASLDEDAYTEYLEPAEVYFNDALRNFNSVTDVGNGLIREFLVGLKIDLEYGTYGETMGFIEDRKWHKLDSAIDEFYSEKIRGTDKREVKVILNNLKRAIQKIHEYFNNLESGIVPNSKEILFDGPKYIIVNQNLFDKWFEWDGSEWRLNDRRGSE